jgi:hypothetical protein
MIEGNILLNHSVMPADMCKYRINRRLIQKQKAEAFPVKTDWLSLEWFIYENYLLISTQ